MCGVCTVCGYLNLKEKVMIGRLFDVVDSPRSHQIPLKQRADKSTSHDAMLWSWRGGFVSSSCGVKWMLDGEPGNPREHSRVINQLESRRRRESADGSISSQPLLYLSACQAGLFALHKRTQYHFLFFCFSSLIT